MKIDSTAEETIRQARDWQSNGEVTIAPGIVQNLIEELETRLTFLHCELRELAATPSAIERLIDWHSHQLTEADAMGYRGSVTYHEERIVELAALRITAIQTRIANGYSTDIGQAVIHPATLAAQLLGAVRDESSIDDAMREMHNVIDEAGLIVIT